MLSNVENAPEPASLALQNIVPEIGIRLNNLEEKLLAEARLNHAAQEATRRAIEETLAATRRLTQIVSDVLQGRATISINMTSGTHNMQSLPGTPISHSPTTEPPSAPPGSAATDDESATTTTTNAFNLPAALSLITLSRSLTTVQDLCREYKEGLGGNVSVESNPKLYRQNNKDHRYFYRRNHIWNFIIDSAEEKNAPEHEIVEELEVVRLRWFGSAKSLDWLGK